MHLIRSFKWLFQGGCWREENHLRWKWWYFKDILKTLIRALTKAWKTVRRILWLELGLSHCFDTGNGKVPSLWDWLSERVIDNLAPELSLWAYGEGQGTFWPLCLRSLRTIERQLETCSWNQERAWSLMPETSAQQLYCIDEGELTQ